MMLNRRLFLGGSASVAVLAALAACAKNSDSGEDASGKGAKTGEAAAKAMNLKDRSELKEGGELKFAMQSPVSNWNASTVEGNTGDTRMIMNFVSPYFFDWADDGTPTPNPNFLTKAEASEVGDKTVVEFELNEKAVWGNGRAMDGEDIKESLIHGTDPEYKWASAENFDKIESVEVVGKRGAKVTFVGIYPDWSSLCSGFGPKELMSSADTFNNAMSGEGAFNNDFFAGPFKVESYDQAQQVVSLVPNDKWWGDKPLLEKVTFRALDSAAEATAFANKDIDVLDYIISSDVYQQAIGRDDAEVRQNFGLQWRHFTLNGASGVLADQAVRQAVLRGCDREAIAKSDLAGLPVEVDKLLLGNHYFMPSQKGYKDNSGPWSYDVEASKKLLEDAGWTVGSDGIREKDGKRLSIAVTIPSGVSTAENETTLLQSQLKEVGIEITINAVESAKFFDDYVAVGNYEIAPFTWVGTQYPLANAGQQYKTGSGSNFSGLSVPEIDKLVDEIATEGDPDKRIEKANELDALVWEQVFNFPMYEREHLTAVPKNLANFGAYGLASYRPENIGYVKD